MSSSREGDCSSSGGGGGDQVSRKGAGSSVGGWDCKFVEEPPRDLICLLCRLPARDPQQVTCCSLVFCNTCLSGTGHKKCPNCSTDVVSFPDGLSDRHIHQLLVHCSSIDIGCDWSGKLWDLCAHSQHCGYQPVPCPRNCTATVTKNQLEEHTTNTCTLRQFKCPHCSEEGTFAVITDEHIPVCPKVKVRCPNACGSSPFLRSQLSQHQNVCPNEVVLCSFYSLGCTVMKPRNALHRHEEQSQHRHLNLAAFTIEQLKSNILDLEQKVAQRDRPIAVFKIPEFEHLRKTGKDWTSAPFLTHPGGYRMCLNVEPGGHDEGAGSHISVFVYLMRGENDATLSWPCTARVCVELLNQISDIHHHSCEIDLAKSSEEVDESAARVTSGEVASSGHGPQEFIAHAHLVAGEGGAGLGIEREGCNKVQYLLDDCLFFRVYATCDSVYKPWLKVMNNSSS